MVLWDVVRTKAALFFKCFVKLFIRLHSECLSKFPLYVVLIWRKHFHEKVRTNEEKWQFHRMMKQIQCLIVVDIWLCTYPCTHRWAVRIFTNLNCFFMEIPQVIPYQYVPNYPYLQMLILVSPSIPYLKSLSIRAKNPESKCLGLF